MISTEERQNEAEPGFPNPNPLCSTERPAGNWQKPLRAERGSFLHGLGTERAAFPQARAEAPVFQSEIKGTGTYEVGDLEEKTEELAWLCSGPHPSSRYPPLSSELLRALSSSPLKRGWLSLEQRHHLGTCWKPDSQGPPTPTKAEPAF